MKYLYWLLVMSCMTTMQACANISSLPPQYLSDRVTMYIRAGIFADSQEHIEQLATAPWRNTYVLTKQGQGTVKVSSCQQLTAALANGFQSDLYPKMKMLVAKDVMCRVNAAMARLQPSQTSHVRNLSLDESFAHQAPASLGMQISDTSVARAKEAENWQDFSHIIKVVKQGSQQATFYDATGGIQHITVNATGDYNHDGVEDVIVTLQNTVEGGDYATTYGYVLTKLGTETPLTLLKTIAPVAW